ncbi:hypothetical protein COT47_05905 [Candidatus Woesearchaeota archaeon CG08_land_8_20_14_0_20_43_7]|nr:MAG: hypothetical protein COT47_05905 [Candidatus Woesearchaeota archaeon CG08_land_8_20_14_0_20_43_7]
MKALAISVFLLLAWGFGDSLLFFWKKGSWSERLFVKMGLGLATIPVLGVLFNLIGIPLDYRIFSGIAVALLMTRYIYTGIKEFPKMKINEENLRLLIVIVMAIVLFSVCLKGTFVYQYLEDDDPWSVAVNTKYVALMKTFSVDTNYDNRNEPYAQGYHILMGLLHQTEPSLYWTLKFFNVLIVSLGLIWFYLFLTKVFPAKTGWLSWAPVFGAFMYLVNPTGLTHFIWADTLNLGLFFLAFYSVSMAIEDRRWIYPLGLLIAAILVTHQRTTLIFTVIYLIYVIIHTVHISTKKIGLLKKVFNPLVISGVIGAAYAASIYWIPVLLKYGAKAVFFNSKVKAQLGDTFKNQFYGWQDYFYTFTPNTIGTPKGFGTVFCAIALIGLVYYLYTIREKSRDLHSDAMLGMLIFTFLLTQSARLPLTWVPQDAWKYLSIPMIVIASGGLFSLLDLRLRLDKRRMKLSTMQKTTVVCIISFLLLIGSGHAKYIHATSFWSPGMIWNSYGETKLYIGLHFLDPGTRVYSASYDRKVIGLDKMADFWDPKNKALRNGMINMTATDIHSWLIDKKYEYLIIDPTFAVKKGTNETDQMVRRLVDSTDMFKVAHSEEFGILLKVI